MNGHSLFARKLIYKLTKGKTITPIHAPVDFTKSFTENETCFSLVARELHYWMDEKVFLEISPFNTSVGVN
jgi:hypothetical protein